LEDLGCIVEHASFDFRDTDDVFVTIRRWRSWIMLGELLKQHRHAIKPEAIEEIEAGASLTGADVARAMTRHAALLDRFRQFQDAHELLACTVSQVPPFDASTDWPHAIDGVQMDSYIDWMKSAYWISTTFCPAISVPAGFTPSGLPVGLQLVGRPHADFSVLQLAHAFEQATRVGIRRPLSANASIMTSKRQPDL